jgi:hypothetical protein
MNPDQNPAHISALIGNPFYAINIDPVLSEPHPPLVSEKQWIAANVSQIEDLGPEAYPQNLLSILKGNYPRGLRGHRPTEIAQSHALR